MRTWRMLPASLVLVFVFGCLQFGKVDQGRVIEYDKDGAVLTMIRDVAVDAQKPDYSFLPPVTYKIPADRGEMGPEPKAGKRMKLDVGNKEIVIFDTATRAFKTIRYTLIDQQENVGNDNPLVFDPAQKKARTFPIIDKPKRTITIYSGRQRILVTFSVAEELLSLPASTWDSGDEVRIYYKEEGRALRLMNVSKTNIFKK
ncbi:MAG: DUF4881 domain-containing protein [Candidatus Riflebacteria bacterium]|nr:DUF4881 domain-containing protein [Candidatus Riflebacteria bacterium]